MPSERCGENQPNLIFRKKKNQPNPENEMVPLEWKQVQDFTVHDKGSNREQSRVLSIGKLHYKCPCICAIAFQCFTSISVRLSYGFNYKFITYLDI